MNPARLLALLPAACLCLQVHLLHAQQASAAASTVQADINLAPPVATGKIAGVIKDPSGALVFNANIHISGTTSHFEAHASTDIQGRFRLASLPPGLYRVTVVAPGFETAAVNIAVPENRLTISDINLHIAASRTSIEVKAPLLGSASATSIAPDQNDQARSSNAAALLASTPGVTLRENGALGSIPLLHGLGDERTKIVVDGMTITSACPNHMNPPSSYTSPARAAQMTVMPGITPVSSGGDSLGGTISIDSTDPVFASANDRLRMDSSSSGFFRSNGHNYGGAFSEWIANRNLGVGYTASWATNDDYSDGSGHRVTSTYAQTSEQTMTLAARTARNLLVLQGALHHVPYEGFPSAQMDMTRDFAESISLHFRHGFEHALLDTHVYWQGAWHSMNIGKDKSTFPMPMWMPMNTHGRDLGYAFKLDVPFLSHHNLKLGNELHRFVLDDRWPAVPGTAPYMGPNPFIDIHNGRRERLGSFAEVASNWNAKWTTLLGLRNDSVWMNTDPVQGYSMMYAADADAFNTSHRARRDINLDATAWVRYEPAVSASYELGYAHKTRAPNLYERYAWSRNPMSSGMIGWFGDGNLYVGNLNVRPEAADTISGTATWRDATRAAWELRLTPYLTSLRDYIDVDALQIMDYGSTQLSQLQFANHDARIFGADLSAQHALWQDGQLGRASLGVVAGLQHGERLDTSTGLYQMFPPHLRIAFDEEVKGLTAGFDVNAVSRKSYIDLQRHEPLTPGYAFVDMHAGYQRGYLRMAAAADNLLNESYALPLGGVNFDAFMASGWMSKLSPLTGRGRSVFVTLSARF